MASSLRTTALRRLTTAAASAPARRHLSSTPRRLGGDAHAHGDHYDPPSGWLFGVAPGKYQAEGWEKIWIWGFLGSLGLAGVAYCYKPDTSIQTWALEEARRRLEAEGILEEKE
ncbi:NADH-ubiquinone oxidoreductase [Neofusicoccum parvum]|uniref:NADH dehydrogenase [ubiquinone] 1 beta subcomplex subunit 11, mitochondrial n=2 Tax=Neofusicoccum parvum TaxID=310453 RepID=R1H2K0_BOTPV|nr:putative nadh-ubiquinone oxidoreductase protein [Neofusicoccum parvum UCRNP2]GME43138.1 NADH-ubiquinone oxidoreductase [Neofusicoccum parvum]GME45825.1 NADH-ubiquinone oxidoreductase [Neofusicoccum parvum]